MKKNFYNPDALQVYEFNPKTKSVKFKIYETGLEKTDEIIVDNRTYERFKINSPEGDNVWRNQYFYTYNRIVVIAAKGWDIPSIEKFKENVAKYISYKTWNGTTFISFDEIMQKFNFWVQEESAKRETTFSKFGRIFEAFLKSKGYENYKAYATEYGIGVWSIFEEEYCRATSLELAKLLKELNIEYYNEWSDAMWVYRFKISKSESNLQRIKELTQ